MDLNIYTNYLETFLTKTNISYDSEKLNKLVKKRNEKITDKMKKIFENKYGVSIEESTLGKLILIMY